MTHRFMMFIDGSNLHGVSNKLDLKFPAFGSLVQRLFKASVAEWRHSFADDDKSGARFVRAYYYSVGSMDEWDLEDATSLQSLRNLFENNRKASGLWRTVAEQQNKLRNREGDLPELAWQLFLDETRRWYGGKIAAFDGTQRFLHGLESDTNFIEVNRDGHWKLDLLNHTAHEKGVDTGFSVAMAAMTSAYDVAILVSGDSDGIPAIRHLKREGRQVGVIDFYKNESPDYRGPNLSKALRREVDFITSISDAELLEDKIGVQKPKITSRT